MSRAPLKPFNPYVEAAMVDGISPGNGRLLVEEKKTR